MAHVGPTPELELVGHLGEDTVLRNHLWERFIVQRPGDEPGFELQRTALEGRTQLYQQRSYAVAANPAGRRYSGNGSR